MAVESQELRFRTHREGEIIDITDKTQRVVESSRMRSGVAVLFVPGSTGAITTIEYEPGLLADLPIALERLVKRSPGRLLVLCMVQNLRRIGYGKYTGPHKLS